MIHLGTADATNPTPVFRFDDNVASDSSDHVADDTVARLNHHLTRMSALTELVAHIESSEDVTAACQVLAAQLKSFLSVEHVLIGICGERSVECTLTAISDIRTFHPRGELAVAAQGALQESIARGESICWPAADPTHCGGLLAHQQFAQTTDVQAIVSTPFHDAKGQLRGAWLITGAANDVHSENVISFLQAANAPVASALNLVARGQKGVFHRAFAEGLRLVQEKRGQTCIAALALFAFILCLPFHYHPRCECTVEPVTRRYVAAPFAGPLEKALVEPGDIVEAGQILARMDGRELRMELSGARADLHRATKTRAGHLAIHDSGESEVARYDVDRLQMRTELLEHREKNVAILSPIAGIVVSGDLEDAEGMPLDVGQTLFEIAPLDEMVVEVSISEADYSYVRSGMPVTVRLDAFPLRRFHATIQRVHPRAELRGEANVFVAEVHLEDASIAFRPGMRGTAKVEADRYPLGWNWFRRPITATIAWLGW